MGDELRNPPSPPFAVIPVPDRQTRDDVPFDPAVPDMFACPTPASPPAPTVISYTCPAVTAYPDSDTTAPPPPPPPWRAAPPPPPPTTRASTDVTEEGTVQPPTEVRYVRGNVTTTAPLLPVDVFTSDQVIDG